MSIVEAGSLQAQKEDLLMTSPQAEATREQKNGQLNESQAGLSFNQGVKASSKPAKIVIGGKFSSNRPPQLSVDLNHKTAEQLDSPGFNKDWSTFSKSQIKCESAGLKAQLDKKSMFKIGSGSFKLFHRRQINSNKNLMFSPVAQSNKRLAKLGSFSDTDEPKKVKVEDSSLFSPMNEQQIKNKVANLQ